jgi:hypothetical protein
VRDERGEGRPSEDGEGKHSDQRQTDRRAAAEGHGGIAPGVPHEVFNVSDTESVVAVVASSDPSEWQNIIPDKRP